MTYKVLKNLRGQKKKKWIFLISENTDTSVPNSLEQLKSCYGAKSEVGLIEQKGKLVPIVVQGQCHPPYILPVGKLRPVFCQFN